jgi:hypothetical protein
MHGRGVGGLRRTGDGGGADDEEQPGLGFKDEGAGAGSGGNGGHDLKGAAVKDFDLVVCAVAYVAEFARGVESDGAGVVEAGDLAGKGTGIDVDHLDLGGVSDVKPAGGGVRGEVVPTACAADDPGLLDRVGAVGELGCAGDLLGLQSGAGQQGDGEETLHGNGSSRIDARTEIREQGTGNGNRE